LGILAHVDAGKTTLTERLLYASGAIAELGSVDEGTTQTDSLALERQRGITIKSAVAAFSVDGVAINLIDTPGHPDFIAEVERALGVLDGAVLVVSAVEGVQPQTRVLLRALRRLRVPTLLFVNKIDRPGAACDRVIEAMSTTLTPAIVAMGSTRHVGTRRARFIPFDQSSSEFIDRLTELIADHDESILDEYLSKSAALPYEKICRQLAAQTKSSHLHPVFFGSALTGAGIGPLMKGIVELLPLTEADAAGLASGRVFKVERGRTGERIAYVRMFAGSLRTRDRVRFGESGEGKITSLEVFAGGPLIRSDAVVAGQIAKACGLRTIRVGDAIGAAAVHVEHQFGPPTFETVVEPRNVDDRAPLRAALVQLADQDPLINVRQDDLTQLEISVSLYGEVQKEVIAATLANDFGIDVTFRETTTIYVERPIGTGAAIELLQDDLNPFSATVGLRVEPGAPDMGVQFRIDVDPRSVPTHIYKTAASFTDHMAGYVRRALRHGLSGWEVTDCLVTMTDCGHYASDGPRKPTRPMSRTTSADFRDLTPIVVLRALQEAGTVVCAPVMRVDVEVPPASVGVVWAGLARLGAVVVNPPIPRGGLSTMEALMPAAAMPALRRQLPRLTSGEGVVEARFAGYEPVGARPDSGSGRRR
jgi:ribosomal protection tetracycline resistance protein